MTVLFWVVIGCLIGVAIHQLQSILVARHRNKIMREIVLARLREYDQNGRKAEHLTIDSKLLS